MDIQLTPLELSELIGDIYESALTGNWDDVLDRLMGFTNSNKAFFFLHQHDVESPLIMEYKANFVSSPAALIAFQERAMEDPGIEVTKFMTEGDSLNINKHLDVGSHKHTTFYQDIYKPLNVFHALAGLLCRDENHESFLVTNRGENSEGYDLRDENLFQLITPHFSRAMHIFKELRLYKNYSNISKSILDQQDKAILVCDSQGTILLNNHYAEQHLALPSAIIIRNNKIHITDNMYQQHLEFFIKQCSALAYKEIGLQETLVIEQQNGENDLITVSPLINQNAFNDIDVPCCLVTVNKQRQINWKHVQNKFELTPKELQLIRSIHGKKKLNDLTHVFNVSYNTLRTHLQSIFKKAEVNSQTELLIKLNMFQS